MCDLFYYSLFCEKCKTETTHLIAFVRYEKDLVFFNGLCMDCYDSAEDLGIADTIKPTFYKIEPRIWFQIIPVEYMPCEN